MPVSIDRIFLTFGFILLFTLFIGTRAGPAIDVAYPDRFFVCQSFSVFFLKKSFFN